MITAKEIQDYVTLTPNQSDETFEITEKHMASAIRLPNDWLQRVLHDIETDLIYAARNYRGKVTEVKWWPNVGLFNLYGRHSIRLTRTEIDIVKLELAKFGYELVVTETSKDYFDCKVKWA